jgi:putative aldouronate transport system substrate-binding protein
MKFKLLVSFLVICAVFRAFAAGQVAPVAEPRELTITVRETPIQGVSWADGLPVLVELEKRTGISLNYNILSRSDFDTVMKTRIAAEELDDIFMIPAGVDILRLARGGILLRLDELFDAQAPNVTRVLEDRSMTRGHVTTPNGEIFVLPATLFSSGGPAYNPQMLIYRSDWARNVGINEAPETIEDWYELLSALRTKDANQNGEQDEYPFIAPVKLLHGFASAYGLNNGSEPGGFRAGEDGTVEYGWITPGAKEYLTEISKWYAEGLIHPETFSLGWGDMWSKLLADEGGVTYVNAASNCGWLNDNNELSESEWIAALPPRGPSGGKPFYISWHAFGGYAGVNAKTDSPNVAVELIDYIYSDEGAALLNIGIKGVHWDLASGKPQFTDAILLPAGKWFENLYRAGATLALGPRYMGEDLERMLAELAWYDERISPTIAAGAEYLVPGFPRLMASPEEGETLSKMVDITTYVEENVATFIIGSQSLDNFDSFVATVRDLGIDEVLAVKQAQYDRFLAAQ